jgi:hypothetical protein
MGRELAGPLYQVMLKMVRETSVDRSSRNAIAAETWRPVVEKHSPRGLYVGEPCSACEQPWPCKTLHDVLVGLD